MNGKDIFDRILGHQFVYEQAAREVPPYRLLCSEHKKLVGYIEKLMGIPSGCDKSLLGYLHGVEIEVVMKVEEYL